MKSISFGKQGLKASTPKEIKTFYRLILLLSTLWVMTLQPNLDLSEHIQMLVNKWVLIGNGAFYTFCQFFGYAETETDKDNVETTN